MKEDAAYSIFLRLYIANMSIIKRIQVIIILSIAFLFDSNDILYWCSHLISLGSWVFSILIFYPKISRELSFDYWIDLTNSVKIYAPYLYSKVTYALQGTFYNVFSSWFRKSWIWVVDLSNNSLSPFLIAFPLYWRILIK